MQLRYPASFLQLLLIGFALSATPLIIALTDTHSALKKLMQRSEYTVGTAVRFTRESRLLGVQLTALERSARQQLVLPNQESLKTYSEKRTDFLDTIRRLDHDAPHDLMRQELKKLQNGEAKVWELVSNPPPTYEASAAPLRELFANLASINSNVSNYADSYIEKNLKALRVQTEFARHELRIRVWALILTGLVLFSTITYLIRKPIRQIADAIRNLGEGRFDQIVSVRGPRDLEVLGQELNWLRLRLTEVESQKNRFLQLVSHELKTPLTALTEGVQLMSDHVVGPLTPAQEEIVTILLDNSTRLRQLIETLLDYSAIRFQPAALQPVEVDLENLFEKIAKDQKPSLTSRQINLQLHANSIQLSADAEKLRIILDNLISNAVKYAPKNSTIELLAARQQNAVIIEVADNGPGIAAAESERLFEPFVQGTQPPDAPIKGTGLGLSIVKEFVHAHGGEVTLMRNQPNGMRVRVHLPQNSIKP